MYLCHTYFAAGNIDSYMYVCMYCTSTYKELFLIMSKCSLDEMVVCIVKDKNNIITANQLLYKPGAYTYVPISYKVWNVVEFGYSLSIICSRFAVSYISI